MTRRQFIVVFAVISFLVATSHAADVRLSLGYHFSWFDLIPHTLGGVWLVFFSYIIYRVIFRDRFSVGILRTTAIFIVVATAIAWEFFEVWYGVALTDRPGYIIDTISDFVADALGATLGFRFLVSKIKDIL